MELAFRVALASRGVAQRGLCLNQRRVLLRVEMGSPFHRLLGAKENRDKNSFEGFFVRRALMPLFHNSEIFSPGVVGFP